MKTLNDFKPLRAVIRPMRAVIHKSECIGCVKCIHVCPVDAIIGAAKKVHTVIADKCIGCERCLPPCPVDCIDMVPMTSDEMEKMQKRLAQSAQSIQFKKIPLGERKAAIAAAVSRKKQ